MTNQDQLNRLTADFKQWRLTRQYPRAKTPQSLKDQTVALAQHYSASQIKTAINIADSTFHNWCQQAASTNNTHEFIAIPEEITDVSDTMKLAITSKNGHQLQLSAVVLTDL